MRRAEFRAFVDATAELQKVDMGGLSRAERMAFWINTYNILVVRRLPSLLPGCLKNCPPHPGDLPCTCSLRHLGVRLRCGF